MNNEYSTYLFGSIQVLTIGRGNLGKMGHLTLIAFYGLFIYFVDTTKVYILCKIVSSF